MKEFGSREPSNIRMTKKFRNFESLYLYRPSHDIDVVDPIASKKYKSIQI